MTHVYKTILVGIDGSDQAELAFEKGVAVAKRNHAKLVLAHIIDTRALQNVNTLDASNYEIIEQEAKAILDEHRTTAMAAGVTDIETILELGNPKTLLATEIPDEVGADLIMVGATGLNAFERLLIGSSSEYILRHAKVDLLIVRDPEKTL
ncbi:universal stress protein [Streptococcus caprae]|uniref:Universal stress protein n=1 Tax=Streptococcus caprae TaxID=1640501 RepID=A0ABV8CVS8_9STRE